MRTPSLPDVSTETKLVVGLIGGSEFVNHAYLVLFPPILGFLATDFEVSLGMLGLAMGLQGFTNTVFQLPFGYLSDNYDRQFALALSLALSTGSVFVIALAPTFEVLLAGQALLGIGVAGHHPVHFPLLAAATPENLRGRAFSIRGFLGSLGFAAPPAVVTGVIAVPGLTWRHAVGLIGAFGAVYAAITLLTFWRFVDDEVTTPDGAGSTATADERSIGSRIRSELRAIVAAPAIVALAVLALASSIAGWGVTTYVVVLLQDGYGVALNVANLTLTGMFVAGAVMVLVGGDLSDRYAAGPVILSSYAGLAVLVALLASLVVSPVLAVLVALVLGGVRSLGGPARSKLADVLSSRSDLGRNFAIITVGTMSGSAIAPPVFGALIERAGLRVTFFVVAAVALVALLITLAILQAYGAETGFVAGPAGGDD
ncbi:MAG TPA: MFS transporter [Natrialbaceae archaeon]|nr:MFS transporter [Natrialbaceae archaeon]